MGLRHRLLAWSGSLLVAASTTLSASAQPPIRNVVLVHGAWVDGSGWEPVWRALTSKGFHVTVVQEPLSSFAEDVAAVQRALAAQTGPCVLVAHSYGGSVISEAGNDPHVAKLVYIAAHMPDAGESEAEDGKRFPSEVSKQKLVTRTPDGYTMLPPDAFPHYFAADLPADEAAFVAHAQVPTAAAVFDGKVTHAAWRSKPSYMLVAGADLVINPDLERWYAKRAGSVVREAAGASHSVYRTRPDDVVALIEQAAGER
jgi:pimeloyl-ACP methyl ester carboxylesterase